MLRILVDCQVDPSSLERLQADDGLEVRVVGEPIDSHSRSLPTPLIADVDLLLCTYPPKNLDDMARLRFIQITSTGYTQLFGLRLAEKGIRVSNSRGVFDTPIAEWNVAMMINLRRDVRGLIRNQEEGMWEPAARFQGEIRGATVGLWGYGGIGRETARLAKALGLTVHTLTRAAPKARVDVYRVPGTGDPDGVLPDQVFTPDEKEFFLRRLDFLIMALPLTRATTGLVGEQELRWLPHRAYLLNPARGPLIQEAALLRALRDGWIAGAALDTHFYYPMPPDHPLWRMPQVIMTPHISGSSGGGYFLPRIWDIFLQNIQRWRQGRPLLNELTPAELAGE